MTEENGMEETNTKNNHYPCCFVGFAQFTCFIPSWVNFHSIIKFLACLVEQMRELFRHNNGNEIFSNHLESLILLNLCTFLISTTQILLVSNWLDGVCYYLVYNLLKITYKSACLNVNLFPVPEIFDNSNITNNKRLVEQFHSDI